jgi:hypothetical protein
MKGGGMESNWVHAARLPPISPLYLPRVIIMMEHGRGNRSIRKTPAPLSLHPPQIPHDLNGREPGPPL